MIYIHEYYKLRTKINNKLLIVLPYLYFTRYLGYLGVSKFLPNFVPIYFFRTDFGPEPGVCCSESQIDDLLYNFDQGKIFLGRCPTCYYNFRMNFCDMTCRPDQSKFLRAKTIEGIHNGCTARPDAPGRNDSKFEKKYL